MGKEIEITIPVLDVLADEVRDLKIPEESNFIELEERIKQIFKAPEKTVYLYTHDGVQIENTGESMKIEKPPLYAYFDTESKRKKTPENKASTKNNNSSGVSTNRYARYSPVAATQKPSLPRYRRYSPISSSSSSSSSSSLKEDPDTIEKRALDLAKGIHEKNQNLTFERNKSISLFIE